MEESEKAPVFKASLVYGAVIGVIIGLISLVLYFIDQSQKDWVMVVTTVIFIFLVVGALIMFRKDYGQGYAKFGHLVMVSFIVGIVSGFISSTFTFALYEMDEVFLQDTKDYAIEQMDERMEKMDIRYQEKLSSDQYDRVEQQMKVQRKRVENKLEDRSSAAFAYSGLFGTVLMSVVIGLIAGIFIKKEPPVPGQ